MSKAFTRESDDLPDDLSIGRAAPTLPPGARNYVTVSGKQRLREELRGRLKSRKGSRESALGRLARRTRGSIPACSPARLQPLSPSTASAGCDRACNAARRP